MRLEQVDEIGEKFVTEELSKDGFWGDTESLLAVSKMYKVNILIFKEKGPYYFGTGYNPDYNRTIFMAYRRFRAKANEMTERECDHYDSVCGIDENLLFQCAEDLGNKMDNALERSNIV